MNFIEYSNEEKEPHVHAEKNVMPTYEFEEEHKAVLFPMDYFDRKCVDPELKKEYDAAKATGCYDRLFLFDFDLWRNERRLSLSIYPYYPSRTVYRGWMMKPEEYEAFYNELRWNNIILITSPEEYNRFHVFPNIHKEFGADTPKMLTYPEGTNYSLEEIKKNLGRFMVKDYVKSVKGTEFPTFFDMNISEKEFEKWMEKFLVYRGNLFTGGLCFKEYVKLKTYSGRTNEYRVFYVNGEIISVSRNSEQPVYAPATSIELIEKYRKLDGTFYTVDYAELEDGTWRVLEAGDGSVSGLSVGQDPEAFFRKLSMCF